MKDLIIVGDSHARALANGAMALGYDVASYANSAGAWRDGAVSLTAAGEITSNRARARKKIEGFAEDVGAKAPLLSGVPVVASLCFDVSQFVSDLRWHKLGSYLADDHGSTRQSVLSSRFTRAYVREQHSEALAGLSAIAQVAPLVVIVPPVFRTWPLQRALKAEFTALVRSAGISVYDPNESLAGEDGLIPDALKHDDGQHGNPAFGQAALTGALEKGLLPAPATRLKA